MSRKTRPRRTGLRRLLPTWRMLLGGFVLLLLLAGGAFALAWKTIDIPAPNAKVRQQNNTWLYRDGSVLAVTGPVNRENVPIGDIPHSMRYAAVSAENRTFYTDPGIDVRSMVRSLYRTVVQGRPEGGSTITQQYVKNYYLTQSRTLTRKVKELFIAMKVDRRMSKDAILAGYLNSSFYGRGAYGVQAAAHAYYDRDAKDLTVGQSAYLATLLNRPTAYDVRQDTPEQRAKALARWNWILDGMVAQGHLSEAKRAGLTFPEPVAPRPPAGLGGQAGYLVEAAKNDLLRHKVLSEDQLDAGGWRITTTFDAAKVRSLGKAVSARVGDQLDPEHRKADRDVRIGGASVDPKTGRVVALHGGTDYLKQWRSAATNDDYQVGSTFKPVVLAAALAGHARTQDGERITPGTYYSGRNRRPVRGLPPHAQRYAPPNEGEASYGDITARTAMDKSVNAVYVQMAVDAGLKNTASLARRLGLRDVHAHGPSIALGVSTHSPLDMASVYATLDNHGRRIEPWTVSKVRRSTGEQPKLPEHRAERVLPAKVADQVTDVLRGVVDDPGGTGYAARRLDRPAAGKTGTTDDLKSVWFTGYTPQLATSIALFGWDEKAGKQVTVDGVAGGGPVQGGTFPARIWTDYMRAALKGRPVAHFPKAHHRHDGGGGGAGGGWSPAAPPTGAPSSPADPDPTGSAPGGPTGGPTGAPPPSSPAPPPPTSEPPPPTGPPPPTDGPPPTGGPPPPTDDPPPPTGLPSLSPMAP